MCNTDRHPTLYIYNEQNITELLKTKDHDVTRCWKQSIRVKRSADRRIVFDRRSVIYSDIILLIF